MFVTGAYNLFFFQSVEISIASRILKTVEIHPPVIEMSALASLTSTGSATVLAI